MSDYRSFIGVDPGATGGLAWVDVHGKLLVHSMPAELDMIRAQLRAWQLGALGHILACVEEVAVRPFRDRKKGPDAPLVWPRPQDILKLAQSACRIEGLLCGLGIEFVTVAPKKWQRVMFAQFGLTNDDSKQASVRSARAIWPEELFRRTPRCRTPSDGMTDAALIAEYLRREHGK